MQLIILSGSSGSGKTYFSHQLQGINPLYVIISSDEVRDTITGRHKYRSVLQKKYIKTFIECNRLVLQSLSLGNSVIYDSCNITPWKRRALIRVAKYIPDIEIIGVKFQIPLHKCFLYNTLRKTHTTKRLHIRLMHMLSKILKLSYSDGFDRIVTPEVLEREVRHGIKSVRV